MSKPVKKNAILSVISREPIGMKCAICGISYDNTLGVTLHMLCNCSAVCIICVKPISLSSVQNGGVSTNSQLCKKCGAMPKYRPYGYLRYRCLPIHMLPLWMRRVVCVIEFILTIALIVGEGKTQALERCNGIFVITGGAVTIGEIIIISCAASFGADLATFLSGALLFSIAAQITGPVVLYGTCGAFHVDVMSYMTGGGVVICVIFIIMVVVWISRCKLPRKNDDGA